MSQREFDLVLCQYELPDRAAFPLLDWLEGSPSTLLFASGAGRRSRWLPVIERGERCLDRPLLKSSDLPDALEKMLDGQVQRSDETIALTESLEQVGRAFTRDPQGRNRDGLTAREREVIQILAEGKSMKEAANILGVTARTIAFHKHRMMKHLAIKTTAELIQVGITKCLISRLTGETPV